MPYKPRHKRQIPHPRHLQRSPPAPSTVNRTSIHKDASHPVYPAETTLNTVLYSLHLMSCAAIDEDSVDAIQMNATNHECVCSQDPYSDPARISHYCCGECRYGQSALTEMECADFDKVLSDYNFNEQCIENGLKQMAKLLARNIPLSLYVLSSIGPGTGTLFFADIPSMHKFAVHLAHASVRYYARETFLHHTFYWPSLAGDRDPIDEHIEYAKGAQSQYNQVVNRIIMGYTGGGVGVASIDPIVMTAPRGGRSFLGQFAVVVGERMAGGVIVYSPAGVPFTTKRRSVALRLLLAEKEKRNGGSKFQERAMRYLKSGEATKESGDSLSTVTVESGTDSS